MAYTDFAEHGLPYVCMVALAVVGALFAFLTKLIIVIQAYLIFKITVSTSLTMHVKDVTAGELME